nr:hypothetical protein [Tanacetum cinerariifolium]
ILLLHQILTFYHGITMIDQDEIMVAVGETDAFSSLDSLPPGIDDEIFDADGDILLLEKLLNIDSTRDLPPQEPNNEIFDVEIDILLLEKLLNIDSTKDPPILELNDDHEGDILLLENLLEDEPSEAKKTEIDPLIREPSNTFLMGDEEIELNSHENIDELVPIPRVSEKPLDSLDPILKTFDMTITNPLFDFDSEFTLNLDDPIFDIQNEKSDESKTETIMD